MSLEVIEMMGDRDRLKYAEFLARELIKPEIRRAPTYYLTISVSAQTITERRNRRD